MGERVPENLRQNLIDSGNMFQLIQSITSFAIDIYCSNTSLREL